MLFSWSFFNSWRFGLAVSFWQQIESIGVLDSCSVLSMLITTLRIEYEYKNSMGSIYYQKENPVSNLQESKNDQEININYIPHIIETHSNMNNVYQHTTNKIFQA